MPSVTERAERAAGSPMEELYRRHVDDALALGFLLTGAG